MAADRIGAQGPAAGLQRAADATTIDGMHDEDYSDEATDYPLTVRVACVLWIAAGVLVLLGPVAIFAQLLGSAGSISPAPVEVAVAVVVFPFAMLCVFGSVETLRGRPNDVLLGAVASVIIGVLLLVLPVVFDTSLKPFGYVLLGIPVSLLVSAGPLAIVGRSAYVRWRGAR